eukprot:63210_1
MGQCTVCVTGEKEQRMERMYKQMPESSETYPHGETNIDEEINVYAKPEQINEDDKVIVDNEPIIDNEPIVDNEPMVDNEPVDNEPIVDNEPVDNEPTMVETGNADKTTIINEISSSSSEDSLELKTDDDYAESQDDDIVIITDKDAPTDETIISQFKDAIQTGNESLVMYHIEHNTSLNLLDIKFENNDSCLHIAVRNKSYKLIIYLLSEGVSPNTQNDDGETCIHTATRTREIKCVTLLSKYNADINKKNNNDQTALMIAAENGDEDIIELLSPVTQTLIDIHIKKESTIEITTTDMNENPSPDVNVSDTTVAVAEADKKALESVEEKKSFDDTKYDEKQSEKTKVVKINPFSKMKRKTTQKALMSMQNIVSNEKHLPKLEGWLKKKKKRPPYSWQNRWVIVKDEHLVYADTKMTIQDPRNPKERAKFNGHLSLMAIIEIASVIKSKKQDKFKIIAKEGKNKKREYLFKAGSQNDRNYW